MKPKKLGKRLLLSKTTIADLGGKNMNEIKGGVTETQSPGTYCGTQQTYCPEQTCLNTDCACNTAGQIDSCLLACICTQFVSGCAE